MRMNFALLLCACFLLIASSQVTSVLKQTQSFFTTESLQNAADKQGWTVTGNSGSDFAFTCGAQRMFGGYGRFGAGAVAQRTFTNLPSHSTIRISGKFAAIDSWDGENFIIKVDNQQVFAVPTSHSSSPSNICGGGWPDQISRAFDFNTSHSATSVTVLFTSGLNQGADDESWGISDLTLEFYGAPDVIPAPVPASVNYKGSVIQDGVCGTKCKEGYVVLNGVCKERCPENLVNDNGSCRDKCRLNPTQVARLINGLYICFDKCNSTEVLTADGKCEPGCPVGQVNDNGVCRTTCTDKPGQVIDGNTCQDKCSKASQVNNTGTCSDACSAGLVNNSGICDQQCSKGHFADNGVCKERCEGTNSFYSNNTCVSSCAAPLLTEGNSCVVQCTAPKVQSGTICKDACDDKFDDIFGKTYRKKHNNKKKSLRKK